jgi:hypothetical protein
MKGEVVGQFFFKGDHPSQFLRNLVQQFQRDLNVIFYQNMPNLHNWNKSAERKIFTEISGLQIILLIAM